MKAPSLPSLEWARTGHTMLLANVAELGAGAIIFGGVNGEEDKTNSVGFVPLLPTMA